MIVAGVFMIGLAVFFLIRRHPSSKQLSFGQYRDYNVLLITLDTTRADHLPVYGYQQVKTPHLDRLAEESYVFENAVSHAPLTLPAHTSIMTSLLPFSHGVRDNSGFLVDQKDTTLAEILKSKGYTTGAFVSAFVLDSTFGLDQGFDLYFDHFDVRQFKGENVAVGISDIQRAGGETISEAQQWLRINKDRRFFCWVHLYDPHDPYAPPEPYSSVYSNKYDGEIAYTDETIGRLSTELSDLKLDDRTIVVVTGDHGEGLKEHRENTHGMFLYNTTQHVPLFIRLPKSAQQRVPGVAGHIDLAPTLLELLGIQPLHQFQGASLIPLMNGKEKTERFAYSESIYCELHYGWSPLKAITTLKYRYIDRPKPELFDRIADPDELHNLYSENAALVKLLKSKLDETTAASGSKESKGPQRMDPETEEKLRALGYVSSTVVSTPESRKIDPIDKLDLVNAMQNAWDSARQSDFAQTLERANTVLQQDTNITDAHFLAGTAQAGLNQFPEAIDELMKAISLRPDHSSALFYLGYCYQEMSNLKEAEYWYRKVLKIDNDNLFASMKIGHIYRQKSQPEMAKAYFLKAAERYEKSLEDTSTAKSKSDVYSSLGEVYFAAGELDQAERNMKEALALTPQEPTLHYNLGQILEAEGNIAPAIAEYKKEIEIAPENFKAYNDLGLLYRRSNQLDQAVFCFRKVIDLLPNDPRGYVLLASTYKKLGKNQEADSILRLMRKKKSTLNEVPS